MKFFGAVLLTAYFLARETERSAGEQPRLMVLIKNWILFVVCAGAAFFTGIFEQDIFVQRPLFMLAAAFLTAFVFRSGCGIAIGGAVIAFCVLRFWPDAARAGSLLLTGEVAVAIIAFLYQAARQRIDRVSPSPLLRGLAGNIWIFWGAAILTALIYQQVIQLFSF